MRRIEATSVVGRPGLHVPKTARQRRRRNKRATRLPVNGIKRILFSTRWLSLGLLALSIYALFLVGWNADFYLTTIPVEGVTSIPASEIVAASNLAKTHIFAVDPGDAAQRIMTVPGVISATVTIRWPNHVNIHVTEDAPVAVWIEGSNQYWVTENGRLIPARSASLGLLFIQSEMPLTAETAASETPLSGEDSNPDSPVANIAFVSQDVLTGALMLRQLRPEIERLYYRPATGLSYQDGRGWRVYFGTGNDMEQKLVVYETIVEDLLAQGLTPVYVSVSNQEKPYYLVQ